MRFSIAILIGLLSLDKVTANSLDLNVKDCNIKNQALGCACKGGSGNYQWNFYDIPRGWQQRQGRIFPKKGKWQDKKLYGAKVQVKDKKTNQSIRKALFFTAQAGKLKNIQDDDFDFDADSYIKQIREQEKQKRSKSQSRQGKSKRNSRFKNVKRIFEQVDDIEDGNGLDKIKPYFVGKGKYKYDELTSQKFERKERSPKKQIINEQLSKKVEKKENSPKKQIIKEQLSKKVEKKENSPKKQIVKEQLSKKIERKQKSPEKIVVKIDQKEKDQEFNDGAKQLIETQDNVKSDDQVLSQEQNVQQEKFDQYTQKTYGKGFKSAKAKNLRQIGIINGGGFGNGKLKVKRCNIFSKNWRRFYGNPFDKDADGILDKYEARRRFIKNDLNCKNDEKQFKSFRGWVKKIQKNIIKVVFDNDEECDIILGGCTRIQKKGNLVPLVGDTIFWRGQEHNKKKNNRKQFYPKYVTCS